MSFINTLESLFCICLWIKSVILHSFFIGKNAQIKVEQRMDHAPMVTEFVVHVSFSLVNSGICSEDIFFYLQLCRLVGQL